MIKQVHDVGRHPFLVQVSLQAHGQHADKALPVLLLKSNMLLFLFYQEELQ